jgi:glucose dehydrogenase
MRSSSSSRLGLLLLLLLVFASELGLSTSLRGVTQAAGPHIWLSQNSGLTALVLFLVQTDWAQFHFGPHHKGYNPYENILSSSNVSALTLDWSYTTRGYVYSSPAVANGVVYIGSADHKLYALDAVTGTPKWSSTTGNAIFPSPAVANGVVYVGSLDDNVYAFHLLGMN